MTQIVARKATKKQPESIELPPRNLTLVGEGPHYSSGGFLYYVDIMGKKIGRYDTNNGKNIFIEVCLFRANHVN